jgi:hypothetical protein
VTTGALNPLGIGTSDRSGPLENVHSSRDHRLVPGADRLAGYRAGVGELGDDDTERRSRAEAGWCRPWWGFASEDRAA